jgi:hypothetical protein
MAYFGRRKTNFDRSGKKAAFRTIVLGLGTLLLTAGCSPPGFTEAEVPHGTLEKRGDVWVMELSGTPAQRGKAAGRLIGEQLRWALPRYLQKTLRSEKPVGKTLQMVQRLQATVPREHLTQLDALARAAGVDRDSLLLVNLAPEIFSGLSCSCLSVFGSKSAGGGVLMARNLDWQDGGVLRELGLVVIESGSGNRFASVTWPGLVGVVTGMNAHGLSVANLVVLGRGADPAAGVPVMFALRRALESADSVDDAIQLLRKTKRTIPQNYALADPAGAKTVETSAGQFREREAGDGFTAITNFLEEERTQPAGSRYRRMVQASASKKPGVKELQAVLAEVAMDDLNVQAVVMSPARRLIHGSTRERPAASGKYWTLDLEDQLRAPRLPAR